MENGNYLIGNMNGFAIPVYIDFGESATITVDVMNWFHDPYYPEWKYYIEETILENYLTLDSTSGIEYQTAREKCEVIAEALNQKMRENNELGKFNSAVIESLQEETECQHSNFRVVWSGGESPITAGHLMSIWGLWDTY